VVSAKKTTNMQLQNTDRRIGSHGENGNHIQQCQQKLFRRASSLSSSSLFSFRGIVFITQALLFFHVLLVDGSEPTGEPPRLRKDNQEQRTSSNTEGTELRFVRREIMLEEVLFYNDIFATDDEPIPTVRSAIIPGEDPSASDASDDGIFDLIENSTNDDSEDDFFIYPYNVTEDDDLFDNTTLESEQPSGVPSTSPSAITFPPVPDLDDSEDSLDLLGNTPTSQPTDDIDGKIDPPTDAPGLLVLTGPPTLGPPIAAPTGIPTRSPTFPPTGDPTRSPTFPPTSAPTKKPTPGPTQPPTEVPTRNPTFTPTHTPTRIPTPIPTRTPTRTPTPIPTPIPTGPPSPIPTGRPTMRPTSAPTSKPTSKPSFRPTFQPTSSPTFNPTKEPSNEPSFTPTQEPTITRSQNPTPTGSFEPTISKFPSVSPSISHQPTGYPTDSPSATPTIAPTIRQQEREVSGEMNLFPLSDRIFGRDAVNWREVTESFLEKFLESVEEDLRMYDAVVTANIERQFQEANSETLVDSLVIEFILFIDYRSNVDDIDFDQLVWSAFSTPEKQGEYILDLQGRSSIFDPVKDLEVVVEGFVPSPTQAPGPDTDESVGIAVIAGASVGGVALIILIALLVLRRRSGKSVEERGVTETQATPSTPKNLKVSTEILVEPQDDVSTLGDPMFGQGGMMMGGIEGDEMTATVGDDYDYTRHYRNARGPLSLSGTANTRDRATSEEMSKMSSAQSMTMSKLGKMGDNIFADDSSFEEQFKDPDERLDVVAPAGKLGMVIDTPNGSIPVVHAIKDTSVLVDQVRVGDRLLSVDGEDCTGMTAMQVSKLISLKSEKPARVLVFARSSTRTNPAQ